MRQKLQVVLGELQVTDFLTSSVRWPVFPAAAGNANLWKVSNWKAFRRALPCCVSFVTLTLLGVAVCSAQEQANQEAPRTAALSPAESLGLVEVAAGWDAQIIASEPLVIDPVEVAFDDAGRMWIVEMCDYPFLVAGKPQGRVKVIVDSDGDGVFDSATIFADKLDMPTGLALWKQGAVVTLAGEVAYFVDHDGDLVADEKQQWLTGFTIENEQLRANHPRLGPDGWWYIACGLRGGEVQLGSHFQDGVSRQQDAIRVGSRDIRFHLESQKIEAVTGPAQFGLTFDLLGSRFFCSNRNPAVQVVFEQPELTNNALVGLVPSTADVLPAGADSRVYPVIDAWTTSNLHAGQFTAACGLFLLNRDGQYEECFVCEPTGSLVKRETLKRSTSRLIRVSELNSEVGEANSQVLPTDIESAGEEQAREWLASRDPWFRPVNVTVDPNGDIVVVDMHRAVIEHPRWVPEELKNRPDERWGNDAGRIFRISRRSQLEKVNATEDWLFSTNEKPLGARPTKELVRMLTEDNAWIRETVTRLLIEREDGAAIEPLIEQALDRDLTDATRIYSLRLATILGKGFPADVLPSLASEPNDLFLVAALRVARQSQAVNPAFADQLTALMNRSATVEFEVLLSLRNAAASVQQETMSRIVDLGDAYLLLAAGTAYGERSVELLEAWLVALNSAPSDAGLTDSVVREASEKLAVAAVKREGNAVHIIEKILALLDESECTTSCRIGCLSAMASCFRSAPDNMHKTPELEQKLSDFWSLVGSLAVDQQEPTSVRRAAVHLLGVSPSGRFTADLRRMAADSSNMDLLPDILTAWAQFQDPACDEELEKLLVGGGPAVRRAAVSLISTSPRRLASIASKLEEGRLAPKLIGASELKIFTERARGEVKQILQQAMDRLVNSDRRQILADYQSALQLAGDVERGKAVFVKNCATCHKVGNVGVDIGPDISDSRTKQPVQLLTSILDPNQAIDNNYFRFVILTVDGRISEGMIAEETEDAIILLSQDNQRNVIYRDDIEEFKATGVSLMPEGLEAQIDQQAMADLIAFIKGWRYQSASIPGL